MAVGGEGEHSCSNPVCVISFSAEYKHHKQDVFGLEQGQNEDGMVLKFLNSGSHVHCVHDFHHLHKMLKRFLYSIDSTTMVLMQAKCVDKNSTTCDPVVILARVHPQHRGVLNMQHGVFPAEVTLNFKISNS